LPAAALQTNIIKMQTRIAACIANPVTGGPGFAAATPKTVTPTLKVTVATAKTAAPASAMPA